MPVDYDAVVIGSGVGGLTAAVALAQAGQKVLVCERHEVPGGWSHSFTLQGYRFSPGVHYVGTLEPGGQLRRIYEGLGVSGDLAFSELNPDGYDHFLLGEERFDFPKGKERLIERLCRRFPEERKGIEGYFSALVSLMERVSRLNRAKGPGGYARAAADSLKILPWLHRTGMHLIRAYIRDPLLTGILCGQAGDHGLPPSRASVFVHAGITYHYLNGGYYPVGGGMAIPRAFVRALKRAGGEIRLRTPVQHILLELGRASGVRLADGEVRSRMVISNADPETTFARLIGREQLPAKLRRKVDRVSYSTSAVSLFFAVDLDLRNLGMDSGNYWLYESQDVDGIYQEALQDAIFEKDAPPGLFLTVTTLKDPSKLRGGIHTCEAFAFVGYDRFQKWASEQSGARSPDYRALKEDLADRMFRTIERKFPGIRENVVFWDLGTPLTNEHYINTYRGNLYGIAKTPPQIGPGSFPVKSAIPGLYMVGASTTSHGIAGATASGVLAAKKILGCRTEELLTQKGPPLKIYPAEDPASWPNLCREVRQNHADGVA